MKNVIFVENFIWFYVFLDYSLLFYYLLWFIELDLYNKGCIFEVTLKYKYIVIWLIILSSISYIREII